MTLSNQQFIFMFTSQSLRERERERERERKESDADSYQEAIIIIKGTCPNNYLVHCCAPPYKVQIPSR